MRRQLSTWLHGVTPRAAIAVVAALLVLGPAVYASVAHRGAKQHRHPSITVKGNIKTVLRPGKSGPVKVRLRNRRRHTLWITKLRVRVSVDRAHRLSGCSARRDFVVRPLPARWYPVRLPPRRLGTRGRWRSLSSLQVPRRPRVGMRYLPGVDQDACKGAKLRLKLTVRARKRRPGRPRNRSAVTPARTGLR